MRNLLAIGAALALALTFSARAHVDPAETGGFFEAVQGAADDDVPEAGDFGAATSLDANGALDGNLSTFLCFAGICVMNANSVEPSMLDWASPWNDMASNPGLGAERCVFTEAGTTGGGIICEGTTNDNNEQLYAFPASDPADATYWIAFDETDTVSNLDGDHLSITAGTLNATIPFNEPFYTSDASAYIDGSQCTRFAVAATITALNVYTSSSTQATNLLIKTDPSQAGTDVCSGDITADTDGAPCGGFNDASIAAGEWLCLHTPSGAAVAVGATASGTIP